MLTIGRAMVGQVGAGASARLEPKLDSREGGQTGTSVLPSAGTLPL